MGNETIHQKAVNRQSKSGALYSARGIAKAYTLHHETYRILRGLDLEILPGEIVAIIGPSGVGKSTLLNILGLLDVPTKGHLHYRRADGDVVDLGALDLPGKARIRNEEFGFVFQFYHLLPDLNVLENVLLPTMIRYRLGEYSTRKNELVERARHLLGRVGIEERRDFPPSRLSGGERQRAAIARALINEPTIVFCDEPTGNLDRSTGERIHELILELNATTRTSFVIVTHDERLAEMADRKLPMSDGKFVTNGRS